MVEKRKPPKGCYWRGDTLWGRFEIKGNEIRRSLRTDDAKIAEGRLKVLKEKETAALSFGDSRAEWKDAFVSWSAVISAHARPNTVRRYATSLKQIAPIIEGLYVDQIDKIVVNDIVRRRRAAGVTNATIKRDLVALSSVLAHCEDEGWREGNPALNKMRRIKERRNPITLPDTEHVEMVIATAPGLFADLLRCAWKTGCRQNELRWLPRKSLDFRREQITIMGKGNKRRVIDMREAAPILARVPISNHAKEVFWHSDGLPYLNISSNFRRLVASAQKSAQRAKREFRPFRFHDLRHLFAVEWLKGGNSIYELKLHLGHTSVQTTEIYLDFLTADEKAAVMKGSAQKPAHEQRSDITE